MYQHLYSHTETSRKLDLKVRDFHGGANVTPPSTQRDQHPSASPKHNSDLKIIPKIQNVNDLLKWHRKAKLRIRTRAGQQKVVQRREPRARERLRRKRRRLGKSRRRNSSTFGTSWYISQIGEENNSDEGPVRKTWQERRSSDKAEGRGCF
jgi:hypothetical protein